jgi:hypothetical protein
MGLGTFGRKAFAPHKITDLIFSAESGRGGMEGMK